MAGQQFSTNLGLSALPEMDQNENPSGFTEALRVRQALKILQAALDNYTGALGEDPAAWGSIAALSWFRLQNLSRVYLPCSENIANGAVVHFWNNAGVLTARNANATDSTKPARGYATNAYTSGNVGEFQLLGLVTVGGLTPGTTYYLSNTDGIISSGAGTVSQKVGHAMSSSVLYFNPAL